jgi:hypothetical protein
MSSDGIPKACVKIGETPLAIERIKNEANVLKLLVNGYQLSGIRYPKCLYEGDIGKAYVMIQTPVPFEGKNGSKYFNNDYAEVLRALINDTLVKKKFVESEFYNSLKSGVENYTLSYRDVLQNGLDYLEKALGDKEITFALAHADFAPWNMVWKGKEVFIYDWESANLEAPAGIDLVHFLFQTGFLLKKLRGEKLLRYILQNTSLPSVPLPLPEILVLLYFLHMAVTEDEPQQLSPAAVERRRLIKLIAHR